MPELDHTKRRLTWMICAAPFMILTTDLGLFNVSLYSSMSTSDWDLFLGPLEWARAETGGADQGVI